MALRIRAQGLPKYRIILNQLTLLQQSVELLEKDHKSGFVAPGVTDPELIKKSVALDFSAIERSLTAMLALQEGLKRTKTDKPSKKEN